MVKTFYPIQTSFSILGYFSQSTTFDYNSIKMQANYKKLWKLLIDKDMKKTDLLTVANISSNILAKMNKGENVSMDSLQKICKALECDVSDILTFEEK